MILEFKLPINPKGDQYKVYSANSRYFVGAIGRQYGKTTLCLMRAAKRASQKVGVYYWIEPTIAQAKQVFQERFLKDYHPLIASKHLSDRYARLVNGSLLYFKGADAPDSLRGATLDGVVLDECGEQRSNVWPEIVRPMLGVKQGWADFIGTPKGPNWFRDLYLAAKSKPDWYVHHAPSNASPSFPQSEFEEARRSLPERIFRQEYLAEFLDDDSEVFRGIMQCVKGQLQQPARSRSYIMGVDLAKHVDWTVITVWDTVTKHLVAYDRFNQIDWNMQENRILAMSQRYNSAPIVLDATGVGDPVLDRLSAVGVGVIPHKLTNASKGALIRTLQLAIEKADISYPEIPELISELQMYSMSVTKSGNTSYGAPSGYHDDIVISMALAVSELALTIPTNLSFGGYGSTTMSQYRDI